VVPQEKGGQLLNQDRAWPGIYDHTVLIKEKYNQMRTTNLKI
jgi:hypothetical protein